MKVSLRKVMKKISIQEKMRPNECFGCGQDNPFGLQIESHWEGDEVVCKWTPKNYMIGPPTYLYGGISASLIDCHSVNTALSYAHKKIGNDDQYDRSIQMVTGSMNIRYVKPVPMNEVELRATVEKVEGRKYFIKTTLFSAGVACVEGEVLAIQLKTVS
jgi:acyl-coenzyme A thioesterase PaaI-like protein